MRKVIRGYARDKDSNLILVGKIPVPHSKDKRSPAARQEKRILSDKEQRSSRKKLFVSAEQTEWTTVDSGRPKDRHSLTKSFRSITEDQAMADKESFESLTGIAQTDR